MAQVTGKPFREGECTVASVPFQTFPPLSGEVASKCQNRNTSRKSIGRAVTAKPNWQPPVMVMQTCVLSRRAGSISGRISTTGRRVSGVGNRRGRLKLLPVAVSHQWWNNSCGVPKRIFRVPECRIVENRDRNYRCQKIPLRRIVKLRGGRMAQRNCLNLTQQFNRSRFCEMLLSIFGIYVVANRNRQKK